MLERQNIFGCILPICLQREQENKKSQASTSLHTVAHETLINLLSHFPFKPTQSHVLLTNVSHDAGSRVPQMKGSGDLKVL